MTLPSYAVMFRGKPACPCQVEWLPVFEAELLRRGVIKYCIDIYQLIGGAAASGGTHALGGAADLAQTQDEAIWVARQMGADATWHRPYNWDGAGGMAHTHSVLRGCPHNSPARYQIDAVDAGYNGLGSGGRGARDDGPRPLSGRTWQQGIAWAKALQEPVEPSTDFTTAHASGLWDKPPADWARLINAAKDAEARLLTLTETTRDGFLRDVTPTGWGSARNDAKPGQSECSIMWSKYTWEDLGPAYSSQLATTRFKTGNGFLRPPVTAITKPLGHKKTGLEVLVTVLHAPSDVEGPTGFHGTAPRLAAYRESIEAVHESWAKGRQDHLNAARILAGDWNLDYQLPWVRETWDTEFPFLTPCWVGRTPGLGTHGDRVIDWQAGSEALQCVGAKVLPAVDGFDHRPLVAKWAVKA